MKTVVFSSLVSSAVAFGGTSLAEAVESIECEADVPCLSEESLASFRAAPAWDRDGTEAAAAAALANLQAKLSAESPRAYVHLNSGLEEAGVWSTTRIGRRLLETPALMGGGGDYMPTPYGGGGGMCPVGSSWGGTGLYCADNHLFWCRSAGEVSYDIREQCDWGCNVNPPGQADSCNPPPPNFHECMYDSNCPSGMVCQIPEVSTYGGGGWGPYGFCEYPDSRSCFADWECQVDEFCDYYTSGECKKTAGSMCYSNNECPQGYYCDQSYSGQCQPNDNGGSGGKPLNYFSQPYWNTAVQGSNDRILEYIYTEDECAQRCLNEYTFYCASFEYAPNANKCVLSHTVVPVINANGWNLYFRM